MNTAERVIASIDEADDVTELITNEVDNALEVGEFLAEGAEAGMSLFGLQKDLTREDYTEAGVFIGLGQATKALTNKLVFEDGSRIAVTYSAVEPPPVDDEGDTPPE